jgi:hypothetical protein
MKQNNLHEVEDPDAKYYEPKPEGEKQFWKRHIIQKHMDRAGNGDDVFSATNVAKDRTRQPGDPKADLGDPIIGNRPIDQLKGEKGTKKLKEDKMTSAEKSKREDVVKALKKKTKSFKDRYGDRWKDVMYATATKQAMGEEVEGLDEADNPAYGSPVTSDSPGGAQPAYGEVDNNNSHLNNNPMKTPDNKGDVKETLEKIALQAAELHDSLEDGQQVDPQAQSALMEVKDALEQVYEMMSSANKPKNEEAEFSEGALTRSMAMSRGFKTPKLKMYYDPNAKDPYSPEERRAAQERLAQGKFNKEAFDPEDHFSHGVMAAKEEIKTGKKAMHYHTRGSKEDKEWTRGYNSIMHKEEVELDEEGEMEMARNQLMTAQRAIAKLIPMMKGSGDMEAWVQSKLTQGAAMLDTVADYMQSSMGVKEDFEEVDDAEEQLLEELEILELDEATVKDKTGTIVGTHKPGEGFKPNALGKKLGHKPHPTDVPHGTTITKRGRPTGAKSFGASKRRDMTHDEAGGSSEKPSFTDHLLKAADSRTGGSVTFDNGQTHHIPRAHAINALHHLGKPEKPADKNKVRKHIGASKENMDSFRRSGGKLPAEAPRYDPDAKIRARTSNIVAGTKKAPTTAHRAMAQKILAKRKAGK